MEQPPTPRNNEKNYTITLYIITVFLVFLLGWMTNTTYQQFTPKELPPTPGDHIPEKDIKAYDNGRVIINIDKPYRLTKYASTGSMLNLLDSGHNGITIVPNSMAEIKIGDVISYKLDENTTIIHRVIGKYKDENGEIYVIVKGDNNPTPDPYRIYLKNIEGILIALIY